jgi:CRISP-associated protein Cas1
LASDLIEEHRAVLVDRLILTTLNKRVLSPQDFEQDADGRFRLARPAFKKFLGLYAGALNETSYYPPLSRKLTYRHLIEHQVRHYSRVVTGDEPEHHPYDAEAAF